MTFWLCFEFPEEFFVDDWDEFSTAFVEEDAETYDCNVSVYIA